MSQPSAMPPKAWGFKSPPGSVFSPVHVPGVPRPQPRPRVFGRVAVSDTPESRAWKGAVALAWRSAGAGLVAEGPIALNVEFRLPRPARLLRRKDSDGPIPCCTRPDLDNLAKAVLDALTGVAWTDDAQVCQVWATKLHAGRDGLCGAWIVVVPWGGAGGT